MLLSKISILVHKKMPAHVDEREYISGMFTPKSEDPFVIPLSYELSDLVYIGAYFEERWSGSSSYKPASMAGLLINYEAMLYLLSSGNTGSFSTTSSGILLNSISFPIKFVPASAANYMLIDKKSVSLVGYYGSNGTLTATYRFTYMNIK